MFTAADIKAVATKASQAAKALLTGHPLAQAGIDFVVQAFDNSPLPQTFADELNTLLGQKQAGA